MVFISRCSSKQSLNNNSIKITDLLILNYFKNHIFNKIKKQNNKQTKNKNKITKNNH